MEFSVLSHPTSLCSESKGGKICGNHDVEKKALDLESGKLDSSPEETAAILFSHPGADPSFTDLRNLTTQNPSLKV